MALRRAEISDSKFYFILRNQINTRKFSLNKKKIPYSKHQKWFLLNYKKKNNFFFVITHKTKNVGYLRLSKKKKFYDVSICMKQQFRKLNIAYKSLINLKKYIKKNKTLRAKVDFNNISSINLFTKSGFKIKLVDKTNLIMIKKI